MDKKELKAGRLDGWSIGLWAAQIVLAALFGAAGGLKLMAPIADLSTQMRFVADWPAGSVRFIGLMEVLGALGMLAPIPTRILPVLTPLAAGGFAVIQVLAILVHWSYGETAQTLPLNLALLALSMFVVWGRIKKRPVAARSALSTARST